MTIHWERACLAALLTMALGPAAASAQWGQNFGEVAASQGAARQTIVATGTSTIQRKPTQLRLYVQLVAKGKTLEDALAKLKERQEAATTQLEILKADKKSIAFGAPNMSNEQSARKRQIQTLVINQMRSRGKKVPKGLVTPQTVSVSSTLSAQWPLGEESHEKLLLLSQALQEKIKAADLAGSKESEKLSAEEEEFEEEASQMTGQMGEESSPPGQPWFLFVAVLPKEERQKAMADAFAKAKERAAELAKAAGVELGPLVGLTGGAGRGNLSDDPYVRYNSFGGSDPMRVIIAEQAGERQNETMSIDPSTLKFNCNVTAMFQLGK